MKWDSKLYDNKHSFVAEYGKGLLEFVPVDKQQRILDLGCGTGVLTEQLSKYAGYVLGVDGSEDMVAKAKENYPEINFEVNDALKLPYSNEWDVVFSNAVFHWISNHDLLLKNIYNSLKPSGKLICEFGGPDNILIVEAGFTDVLKEFGYSYKSKFNFPTLEEFSILLEKNGFIIDKIYDFDRPTPLQDGENGLANWARQFLKTELEEFSEEQQDQILKNFESKVRDKLWNGKEWSIDYRRLRAVAHVEK